jgi:hypothetical protein
VQRDAHLHAEDDLAGDVSIAGAAIYRRNAALDGAGLVIFRAPQITRASAPAIDSSFRPLVQFYPRLSETIRLQLSAILYYPYGRP